MALLSQTVQQYTARPGATSEAFDRRTAGTIIVPVSGTLYLVACLMPQALPINNLVTATDSTVKAGGTHGWNVVLDAAGNVQAVSADQTDAAATWGSASVEQSIPMIGQTDPTYTGIYYHGTCIVATTMPTLAGSPTIRAAVVNATQPPVIGYQHAGFTTPPALGSNLPISTYGVVGNFQIYSYTN